MNQKLTLLSFLFLYLNSYSAIIYVDVNATGSNNGTSWTNAYTDLQAALSAAFINDDIWVATGTYKPTTTTTRSISFVMKNGVDMYGGFAGTETAVDERDITANPTTLSGDIGQLGDNTDNTQKIVKIQNFTTAFTFDGFRIVSGYDASGTGRGAGMYLSNNSVSLLTFNNCVLYNNYAYTSGGGMEIDQSNTVFNKCEFLYNSSFNYGGGAIYSGNVSGSTIKLYDCQFIGNSSRDGAVINFDGVELIMERNLVTNNTATSLDLISISNGVANFEINNSLIIGNKLSDNSGSIISSYTSGAGSSSLTNVTICHNKNTSSTGPYYETIYQSNSAMLIQNCIVYGNTNSDMNVQIDPGNTVVNSIVENGYSGGTNVITANPLFVNPSTLATAPFDASMFDYSLQSASPAVNTGNNTYALPFSFDYLENARIQQGTVDRGAIESPFSDMIAPVANCSNYTVYLNAGGIATIDSSNINNNSTDNIGVTSMLVSPATFDCSNTGTNAVMLVVFDAAGNSDTCTATVTVMDVVAPVASVQNISVYLDPTGNVTIGSTDFNPVVTDNCGVDTFFVSLTHFTCSNAGPNTVTFTATDVNGNSVVLHPTVTVIDTVFPTALTHNVTVYLNSSGTVAVTAAMINNGSTDDCGITGMTVSPTSFNCNNVGTNTATLTVHDGYGNASSATATVTVLDTISPVTSGHNITVNLATSNPYVITPANLNSGSHDNCAPITQTIDMNSFTVPGIYPVELTTTDPSGNSSSGIYNVTVINSGVGIEENASLVQTIYPNPTTGIVHVQLSSQSKQVNARILDVAGKVIRENVFYQTETFELDFDGKTGFYFLEIVTSDNERFITKILKQ